jgi:predicted RND superfamily exporter protein
MPYEILITTFEEGGVTSPEMLNKGRTVQKALKQFSELSKPMSLVEVVSAANQANNDNDPRFYRIPKATDLGELALKLPPAEPGKPNLLKGFVDSTFTQMRISYQMKDVGSIRMDSINKAVNKIVSEIFPSDQYTVQITGTTAIFLKGNSFLFDSLVSATLWSLLLISLTMGFLFPSFRMIIIAIIPNIIPLLITAGTMGYFNIPLKPSTILVFSIAFGITVDATIHFVSTFRREVIKHNKPIRIALDDTIAEVGLSMIYTMVAICSGFLIFTFSEFQGTAALGWLTGLTIITGMAANLFLLPALILSFEKFINPKIELKEVVMDLPEED